MFDGDAAGRRAAAKALEIALASVNERSLMRFVFLPPEHDPDSFVRAHGAKALEDYVAKGQPLSGFLQSRAVDGQDLATAEGRSLATSEAKRLLALMPHCQLKSQIALELADRLRTDTATLGLSSPRLSQSSRANGGNESNWANRPNGSKTSSFNQRGPQRAAPLSEGRQRRPVLTLGDRLWKALVQRPAMANQLTALAREALEAADKTLLAWFIERSGEIRHFASLHEMLEQETVPPGFRDRLRQAMRSELEIENDPEADFATIQLGLERRALEQQAAELATRAQSDASAMDALRQVNAELAARRQRPNAE
jgi:DNA primase